MKKRFILIAVSLLILAALIWYANPASMAGVIVKSNIYYLAAAFVVATISLCLRVLKWQALLDGVGFTELFPVQMLGITISNFTPGKIAEPLKAIILRMRKGVQIAVSLPSIIWERILDVIVLIVFSLLAIQMISFQSRIMLLSFISIAAFSALIVLLLLVLYNKKIGFRIFAFLHKLPLVKKLPEDFMKNFYESKIRKTRLSLCFIITLVAWMFDGVVLYLTMLALGIMLNPLVLAGIIALSVLIGVASTLPGGLGSTEAVMILLLGVVGVSSTTAVAGVMLSRFISFWYGILVGAVSLIYLSKKIDMKQVL
ncbi:MAG: flippase-like domain-containing protein [Candidatus Aenigmarchaeota archaeon]|nr:flippase-like domain-containing protein [Candidatus Aenigmarchaeota archaeon]